MHSWLWSILFWQNSILRTKQPVLWRKFVKHTTSQGYNGIITVRLKFTWNDKEILESWWHIYAILWHILQHKTTPVQIHNHLSLLCIIWDKTANTWFQIGQPLCTYLWKSHGVLRRRIECNLYSNLNKRSHLQCIICQWNSRSFVDEMSLPIFYKPFFTVRLTPIAASRCRSRYNGDAVHWSSSISLFNSQKSTRSQTWIWEFGGIWDHKLAYWGPIRFWDFMHWIQKWLGPKLQSRGRILGRSQMRQSPFWWRQGQRCRCLQTHACVSFHTELTGHSSSQRCAPAMHPKIPHVGNHRQTETQPHQPERPFSTIINILGESRLLHEFWT